jgi:ribonuclease T2
MIRFMPWLLVFFTSLCFAAIPVSGSFDVTEVCPAFLSKNKQTNPGGLKVHPSESYRLNAINDASARSSPNFAVNSHSPKRLYL